MRLQPYDFDLVYRPGTKMVASDQLMSHAPINLHYKSLTVSAEDISMLADDDNQMSDLSLNNAPCERFDAFVSDLWRMLMSVLYMIGLRDYIRLCEHIMIYLFNEYYI